MTADSRQDRVYNGALALLMHRNGPNATIWWCGDKDDTEVVEKAVRFCADLEAKVASALGHKEAF